MINLKANVYGGKFEPLKITKAPIFDVFLAEMISKKCNSVDGICSRLRITKNLFMKSLNEELFITNGLYVAPKR